MSKKKDNYIGNANTRKLKRAFVSSFAQTLANISATCKHIKISRQTYYDWIAEDEQFKIDTEDISEENIDFAETMLIKNIKNGKETSLIFYLKTKGKKRGYIETTQVEHREVDEFDNMSLDEIKAKAMEYKNLYKDLDDE